MEGALLSNVAGALILSRGGSEIGAAAARVEALAGLFCEVLVVGEGAEEVDALGSVKRLSSRGNEVALLRAALELAEAERVLVLPASREDSWDDLLIGLAAWPEQSATVVTATGEASTPELAAIYLRGEALDVLTAGATADIEMLIERLGGEWASLTALGLGDLLAEAC